MERKKLSDILTQAGEREKLQHAWKTTDAAAEFEPLPKGEYTFRIIAGELFQAKRKGTPGYKLTLEVTEGDYEGRRVWADFWLTGAALPITKRELAKIGITDLRQLEYPLPAVILIKGKLALRTDDDGTQSNRLLRFQYLGMEPGDAFEPRPEGAAAAQEDGSQGNEQRQTGNGVPDEPFPFGANVAPSDNGSGEAEGGTP
jgi:hypothetical protein